jgi:hypothetical protein
MLPVVNHAASEVQSNQFKIEIKFGGCFPLFSSEYFGFPSPTKKCKDQNMQNYNFACN